MDYKLHEDTDKALIIFVSIHHIWQAGNVCLTQA